MHPLHLALTNIDLNEKQKTITITHKLFADDFEKLINFKYQIHSNFGKSDEIKSLDSIINDYIYTNFELKIGTNSIIKKIENKITRKLENNELFVTYTIKNVNAFSKITIKDNFFFDWFSDQTNIIIAKNGLKEKGIEITQKDKIGEINFE